MASSIPQCPRFVQNAWKKDLCSNCFKSKEEHAAILQTIKSIPTSPPRVSSAPAKSIIKVNLPSSKKHKKKSVNFPKEVSEVIGFGGESLSGESDDDDIPDHVAEVEVVYEDDEELQRLTKNNTEFNMNNGNLLGDPKANIKRTFAALKLGAPQKDSDGKKQTLKISVTPFGGGSNNNAPTSSSTSSTTLKLDIKKSKLLGSSSNGGGSSSNSNKKGNGIVLKSITQTCDEISKPIEVQAAAAASPDEVDKSPDFEVKISNEKSLLEEISETLLSKKIVFNEQQQQPQSNKTDVIKVEIKNLDNVTSTAVISSDSNAYSSTTSINSPNKRTITRGNAILKDMEKPKIQVVTSSSKTSESESDLEFGTTSDYYDVVEAQNSYENIPDGTAAADSSSNTESKQQKTEQIEQSKDNLLTKKSHFFSNQTVSEMFMAHQPITDAIKKRAESYNLMDNSFVSSKITSDGLIVTKNHLEDALDSTGSSFDSSSDEELSNNRSESDSGIGIKVATTNGHSNNSSDYEDIQVTNEINKALANVEKSRELAGEPDGRSDPDGSSETSPAPALPSSPQPTNAQQIDARQSFLHSTVNKPKVPIKPLSVNVVKPFQKRNADIILQLQQVIGKERSLSADSLDAKASAKKSRAPEPPLQGEADEDDDILKSFKEEPYGDDEPIKSFKEIAQAKNKFAIKTNTVQIKESRNYPAINPKFRSLNHLNRAHEAQEKLDKFEKFQPKPTTPEPAPRHSLSFSSDSLTDIDKGKKKKFSIKKFLRMGSSSSNSGSGSNNNKTDLRKDYSHYADIPSSPSDDSLPAPQVKPRLIIIHPLDINNTGVEVVSSTSSPNGDKYVSHKPPMPPIRSDTTKLEMNKPTRPPPPKNSPPKMETNENESPKAKAPSPPAADNVYANLGEVRNAIAPRKPERTNSMREREAKLAQELKNRRQNPVGESEKNESSENNAATTTTEGNQNKEESIITKTISFKPVASTPLPVENKKKVLDIENVSTRSKIELFENTAKASSKSPSPCKLSSTQVFLNNDGLKSSVQKMNVTIDNYLKNKKLLSASDTNLLDSRSPTPPQIVASTNEITPPLMSNGRNFTTIRNHSTNGNYEPININVNMGGSGGKYQRASYPDNGMCSPSPVLTFGNAARSYCGSEMGESEIYSPYSFCGSEAGHDVAQGDPNDSSGNHQGSSRNKTVSRLRMRKGRSVVHTNLEDNYSAVIVANHEALAQVLEQLQQPQAIPVALRPILNSLNLRFDDFLIIDSIGLVVGKRVFHQALWQNSSYVTLMLTSDANQIVSGSELNQMSGGVSGALHPITEFHDLVPNNYLPSMPTTKVQLVQATITVLPKLQIETLETMGSVMKSKLQNHSLFGNHSPNGVSDESEDTISINEKSSSSPQQGGVLNKNGIFDDVMCREVGFIILQLINGLKSMQAKGIEEMPLNLCNIIMTREVDVKDQQAKLCILQGFNSDLSRDDDEMMGTLCQCALKVIKEILPETKLTPIISHLLAQERADTLSRTKSVLEYVLWGPSDVAINGPLRERETTLQRWLDLARATVLHGLVRSKIELTIYDECHLIFLVRSNSKIMLDASQIIAANFNSSSTVSS